MKDEQDSRAERFKESSSPIEGEDSLAIISLELIVKDHDRAVAIASRVDRFINSSRLARFFVQPMPETGDAIEVEKNKRGVVRIINDAKPPNVRMLAYSVVDVPGTKYMTIPSFRPWVVKNAIKAERAWMYAVTQWWVMLLGYLLSVAVALIISGVFVFATMTWINVVGITTPLHPVVGLAVLFTNIVLAIMAMRRITRAIGDRLDNFRESWQYAICLFESDVYSSILCDLTVNHGLDAKDAVNVLSMINEDDEKQHEKHHARPSP